MSDTVKLSEFELDVNKFLSVQKKAENSFIDGLLSIGAILREHKARWKPERKWERYLEKINKTLAEANQLIRVFEYDLENPGKLKQLGIANWKNVNSFLALGDELRDLLLSNVEVKQKNEEEVDLEEEISDVKDIGKKRLTKLSDVEQYLSEQGIDTSTRRKIEGGALEFLERCGLDGITSNCLPIIEAFIGLNYVVDGVDKFLNTEGSTPLTDEEKSLLVEMLDKRNKELAKFISKL